MKSKRVAGFTLAELLISLTILGVIATFTIPKVLNAGNASQNTAIAKEAASMVSGAFSSYQLNSSVDASTTSGLFTQYLNYVAVDTASAYTATTGTALQTCSTTLLCLKLHNGGVLQLDAGQSFGGTGTTNALYFNMDPDGNGQAGRVTFVQYISGRLTTGQNMDAGTTTTGNTITVEPTDPTYLQNWN